MKTSALFSASVLLVVAALSRSWALPSLDSTAKVLDLSHIPTVPRESFARSVNLSFFVPAFSLFALASQYMPQMFPTITTTTTSRRVRRGVEGNDPVPDWLEVAISNGLIF